MSLDLISKLKDYYPEKLDLYKSQQKSMSASQKEDKKTLANQGLIGYQGVSEIQAKLLQAKGSPRSPNVQSDINNSDASQVLTESSKDMINSEQMF